MDNRTVVYYVISLIIFGCLLGLLNGYNQEIHPKYLPYNQFAKMAPLFSSIAYRNTSFTCSFENKLMWEMELINISLNESIARGACTVNPTDISPLLGSSVEPGGTFSVSARDCPFKSDGESYDMLVGIQYQTIHNGVAVNHTDMGHIRGQSGPRYEPEQDVILLSLGFLDYAWGILVVNVVLVPLGVLFSLMGNPLGLVFIIVCIITGLSGGLRMLTRNRRDRR